MLKSGPRQKFLSSVLCDNIGRVSFCFWLHLNIFEPAHLLQSEALRMLVDSVLLHSQTDRKTADFLAKQPYFSVACRTRSPDVEGQTLQLR